MKKLFVVILAVLATYNVNAQLLYKISGNGLAKPSYVIGTHHLCDVKFVDQVPGVKEALAASEQVCGELVMSEMQNLENINKTKEMMMLADGKTIKDILSEDEMNRLNTAMKGMIGADFTNPMLMQQLGSMRPAALESQITILLYLLKHQGEFDPQNPFDSYFQKDAIANNKPVIAFETVDYQSKVLYDSRTPEREKEILMCTVDNIQFNSQMLEEMTAAYRAQDLKKMKEITDIKLNTSCDATDKEQETLVYGRNDNWLKLMPQIMSEKSTFFAVGALHLCGERGLIEQLQKMGYSVEGVK